MAFYLYIIVSFMFILQPDFLYFDTKAFFLIYNFLTNLVDIFFKMENCEIY